MGELNVVAASDPALMRRFTHALLRDLKALDIMLSKGMIETGVQRIGAEQELCLVDKYWRPAPLIMEVLEALDDPYYTTELAKFNLEINLDPQDFSGNCLSLLEAQLKEKLQKLEAVARKFEADIVLTGILPTIRTIDIDMENMTPVTRYRALFDRLREMRGEPFEYHIRGNDELLIKQDYPSFEFCNTSFQVHFQADPRNFVNAYNFSKLVSAPILAAAVNSPMVLGKRLWQESRIALFQQAIDTRNISYHLRESHGRVAFAKQWVHQSITEIFQDDIARFRIMLCAEVMEDSLQVLADGGIPKLDALRIFNGTVYRWNRACYGISDGKPHLRIENRLFPAGPTVADEIANSAFWIGLMNGFPSEYEKLPGKIDFDTIIHNFFKASRYGLDTQFQWLDGKTILPRDLILKELLPIAKHGLKKAKVAKKDSGRFLGIIEERVRSLQTGANWMVNTFNKLKENNSSEEALVALTAGIVKRQKEGKPVHTWDTVKMEEAGDWKNKYWHVGQIMSTDLFTVQENDLPVLAANMMAWKHVGQILVEDSQGKLIGLVTSGMLLNYLINNGKPENPDRPVSDIMLRDLVCVHPETPTVEAIAILTKEKIGCLPVVKDGKLIGIVTERDFLNASAQLIQEIF